MKKFTLPCIAMAFALLLVATPASAKNYKIDSGHSTVVFSLSHFNAGKFFGTFNDVRGKVTLHPKKLAKSSIHIKVATGSVFTAVKKRDDHLKGPDFFNSKQFKFIVFKSKTLTFLKKNKRGQAVYKVDGTLRMNGVKKAISVNFVILGTGKDPWGNTRIGAIARFSVNRFDYGIKYSPKGLGNKVNLIVSVEGVLNKKKK